MQAMFVLHQEGEQMVVACAACTVKHEGGHVEMLYCRGCFLGSLRIEGSPATTFCYSLLSNL